MITISDNPLGQVSRVVLPGTVSGLTVFGVPLPDVVYILTAVYLLMQIGVMLYGWLTKGQRPNLLRGLFNVKRNKDSSD